jgi:phenylpyruvate tautomerase PptA (4-oxalocrotonate tautomerase family)
MSFPTKDLIHQVTEAVIPFVGEQLRDSTWVLVEEKSPVGPGELAEGRLA